MPLDQKFILTFKSQSDGRYRMLPINCLWIELPAEVAKFETEEKCTVTNVVHDYTSKAVRREHWK